MTHSFPIRVYYEDTDSGGVVYYANYLKFAERARTEALRSAGIEQAAMMRDEGIAIVVRSCQVEFIRPARLDDLLTIRTQLDDIGNASLILQQTILRGDESIVSCAVRLGIVNAEFRPVRLPPRLRQALLDVFDATNAMEGTKTP